MNRPIKFRAWDGETMHPVSLLDLQLAIVNGTIEDFTLMQFTGFVDKNGTEIYERDVVIGTGDRAHFPEDTRTAQVSFSSDLQFVIASNTEGTIGMPLTWGGYESLEVIGNIYENPELLKV